MSATNEDDGPSTRESRIRSEVSKIVDIHPVTLEMSPQQISEVHGKREQAIRERFPETPDARYAGIIHNGHKVEETKQRQFEAYTQAEPEQLWMPTQRENMLSGFLPIPPMITRGGTSEIWLCKSRFAERTLVVKLLTQKGEVVNLQPALALRELQTLFNLRHPNIVNVYDAGYLLTKDGEFPYVAMEEVKGSTLTDWMKENNKGNRDRTAAVAVSVIANAIQFCHDAGIAHGDLKPDNILIDGDCPSDKTIKIIDFGYSGRHGSSPLGATAGYAAPLTSGSQHLSMVYRDIFSLGGIFYFLRTGEHPRSTDGVTEAHWREWVAKIDLGDPDLTLICKRCLAFDQAERYSSAKQLEEDLAAWLNERPLPHVRKDDYSWWEREKLLWFRGRTRDDLADHVQIIARTLLAVAFVVTGFGLGYLLQIALQVPPHIAFFRASQIACPLSGFLFLACAYATRFRYSSLKILEPLFAFVICIYCVQYTLTSEYFGIFPFPSWDEHVRGSLFVFLPMAAILITFASTSLEWTIVRPIGWFLLLLSFFVRPIFESRFGIIAMPLMFSFWEAVGCLAFASPLLVRTSQTKHRE